MGVVDEGEIPGFLLESVLDLLLGSICGEYVLGIEYFGIDVFELFSFDINRLGIRIQLFKRKVNVEVVLVCYLNMGQPLALLQQHRSMHVFALVLPIRQKSQPRSHIHHLVSVDIHSMENLLLHRQHVKVPQSLQMPAIVARSVRELRIDGNQQSCHTHIFPVESIVSVAEEDETDSHIDCHAEPIVENLGFLEFLPDHSRQSQRLSIASPRHYHSQRKEGCAEKWEELILIDCIFVEGIVGKLALGDAHASEMFDMVSDEFDHAELSCACIAQGHGEQSPRDDW